MTSANSFGSRFVVHTFGESHGPALGAVVDGVPAGVTWNQDILNRAMSRRRPGQSNLVSGRNEKDEVELLSGVYLGKTIGTPLAMIVRNVDARSADYDLIRENPRPGHADDVWKQKYLHVDPRGGGRSSGRETVSRVMGGAVAEMFLSEAYPHLKIVAYTCQVGSLVLDNLDTDLLSQNLSRDWVDGFPARFPSNQKKQVVESLLLDAKQNGKSYGGMAELRITNLPAGLGQPVFHKLKADLAHAMLGIGATAGVDLGEGFAASFAEGTEFHSQSSSVYGGVRGGISTGGDIIMRVAFKPTATVLDLAKKGRHDPCIVPRAISVIEAMASLVIADHVLWARTDRLYS